MLVKCYLSNSIFILFDCMVHNNSRAKYGDWVGEKLENPFRPHLKWPHGPFIHITNEYKLPVYSLSSVCSHRGINLPTIQFPHPIEIGHYFWSNCIPMLSHIPDHYRLIDIGYVMTPHGIRWHLVDPSAIRVVSEC